MAITVDSPYSGKPVKVREQDVRRAVRDEEGRIFYVLPRPDGSGFFGSKTRTRVSEPQQAADGARLPDTSTSPSTAPVSSAAPPPEPLVSAAPPVPLTPAVPPAPGETASLQPAGATARVHDATGRRRKRGWRGRMVIFVLAAIVALLIYLFSPLGPFDWKKLRPPGESPTPKPNPIPIGRMPSPAIDVC